MKKALITIIFLSMTILGYSQRPFRYVSPDFKTIASNHELLAILPFDVSLILRRRIMNNIDPEELRNMEINEGKAIQSSLEAFLLRHKAQKGYNVSFQDISSTNAILLRNNVSPDNIGTFTRAELAQMLGVDGIIYGSLQSNRIISDGESFLIGMAGFYPPPTNFGGLIINVADAQSGNILWKFETGREGGFGSNQSNIMRSLLRRACRRFPYKRL